jgi:hypothetical protein
VTEIEDLSAELGADGYELETLALHNSNFQVVRRDGYGGRVATSHDADGVRQFLYRPTTEDGRWHLSLDHGGVDADRETGSVTGRDTDIGSGSSVGGTNVFGRVCCLTRLRFDVNVEQFERRVQGPAIICRCR